MTGPAQSVPYDTDIAQAAALIADPTRAAMLRALVAGRPLAAGELARLAGVELLDSLGPARPPDQGKIKIFVPNGPW